MSEKKSVKKVNSTQKSKSTVKPAKTKERLGLPSHFSELDDTIGCFDNGTLSVIGGNDKFLKTYFIMQIALLNSYSGVKSVIFTSKFWNTEIFYKQLEKMHELIKPKASFDKVKQRVSFYDTSINGLPYIYRTCNKLHESNYSGLVFIDDFQAFVKKEVMDNDRVKHYYDTTYLEQILSFGNPVITTLKLAPKYDKAKRIPTEKSVICKVRPFKTLARNIILLFSKEEGHIADVAVMTVRSTDGKTSEFTRKFDTEKFVFVAPDQPQEE